MLKAKKPKIDFSSLVASCEGIRINAQPLKQRSIEFTAAVKTCLASSSSSTTHALDRVCAICDEETVQLVLVSRLGLEGVDSLRFAIQAIPGTFASKRTLLVTNVVNLVLRNRGKESISEAECEVFYVLVFTQVQGILTAKSSPPCFFR